LAQSEEIMNLADVLTFYAKSQLWMKKMKRGHEKQENHQKSNFPHFQKCDLRTGFRRSHLAREGPGAPLGVKSAIPMLFSENR